MTTNTTDTRHQRDREAQPLTLPDLMWAHGVDRHGPHGDGDTSAEAVAARVAMLRAYLDQPGTDQGERELLDYLATGERVRVDRAA